MKTDILIRPIAREDLRALVNICEEHAAYEHAEYSENGQAERLAAAFFSDRPALFGWVALDGGMLCGFMTVTVDFATWTAEYFAHLDCIYLREPYRGQGLGSAFFAHLGEFCAARRYRQVQWQTPPDNELGVRFYRRIGATEKNKIRFFLEMKE